MPLCALPEFVDEYVDRRHVVGIEDLFGLIFSRHVLKYSIQAGLEIAHSRGESAGGLLARCPVRIRSRKTHEGRDCVFEHEKL